MTSSFTRRSILALVAAAGLALLVSAGILVLRAKDPDRPRPFRTPFVPVVPILSIVTCLYLMMQLPLVTWIRFGLWLGLGLVLYFLYGYRKSKLRTEIDHAAR